MRSDLFIDIQHAAQICQFIKNEAWEVSAGVSANVSVNEFNVHGMATTRLSVDLAAMSSVWFSNLRSLFMRARAALRPSRTKSKPSQDAARCTVAQLHVARLHVAQLLRQCCTLNAEQRSELCWLRK